MRAPTCDGPISIPAIRAAEGVAPSCTSSAGMMADMPELTKPAAANTYATAAILKVSDWLLGARAVPPASAAISSLHGAALS